MTQWLQTILTALIAGGVGSWLSYAFALRRDKTERRRERYIAHLIEAYRNLENAAGREKLSDAQKDKLESSLAAVFLFGSKQAAREAKSLAEETAKGTGSMIPLLQVIRNDLRKELGLDEHDVSPLILRMWREEELSK